MVNWNLIIIMLVGIIAVIIGTKFVKKWQNKKASQMNFCPPEVLSQFDKAERLFKESNGERNPHEILWEIANEERLNRMKGGNNGKESNNTEGTAKTTGTYSGTDTAGPIPAESRTEGPNSDGQSEGRQSIQNEPDTGSVIDNGGSKSTAFNNKGNFFSRFRRKA